MSTAALLLRYQPSITTPFSICSITRKPVPDGFFSVTMASPHHHFKRQIKTTATSWGFTQTKIKKQNYQYSNAAVSGNSSLQDQPEDPFLPSQLIEQFYSSINDGDAKKLQELISDDCFYEDEAFLDPFKGKKQVMQYLTELSKSMGKNVKFRIDRTFQGLDDTVGVLWHLDWRNTEIPFTRGCSLFDCSNHEGKLVIKKAYIIVESPVKPGMSAVSLLKSVSSTFDRFPVIAEKFLQFQHELISWIVIVFNKFVKPFLLPLIVPILMYYFNVWKLFWKHADEIYNTYLRKIVGYVLKKIFFPF